MQRSAATALGTATQLRAHGKTSGDYPPAPPRPAVPYRTASQHSVPTPSAARRPGHVSSTHAPTCARRIWLLAAPASPFPALRAPGRIFFPEQPKRRHASPLREALVKNDCRPIYLLLSP